MVRNVLFLMVLLVGVATAQPARVLFLGENHRSASDHRGQLEVLKSLEGQPILLALEMLTYRSISFTNDWNQGKQTMTQERWDEEWGHPWELYQPIFEWSRKHALLAPLRPEPELTAQVKEHGAPGAVARLGDFLVGPAAYKNYLAPVFAAHLPTDVPITDKMLNKYFLIQCFWDEYMAWRIAQLADQYPEHRIVVLVGYGHLHPDYGIPARLNRRRPDLRSVNIAFDPEQAELCDILWRPANSNEFTVHSTGALP